MAKSDELYQSVQGINTLVDLADNSELIGDFFRTIKLNINISPTNDGESINNSFDNNHAQRYKITGLSIEEDSNDVEFLNKIQQIADMLSKRVKAVHIDQRITELIKNNTRYKGLKNDLESLLRHKESSIYNAEWSVFYLLKELFQCIKKEINQTLYYRGQSQDWEAIPGVIRPGIKKSYASEFEDIYHNLAFEFEDIDYIALKKDMSLEDQEKRAKNIALLQHFNLLTPYVDITANEFIAMFFMIDSKEIRNPCIDILFQSNNKEDNSQSLVQKAPSSHRNIRLSAQKGSFLNFEKVLVNDSITKIDRIRVVINYDVRAHIEIMKQEKDDLGSKSEKFNILESIMDQKDDFVNDTELEDKLKNKINEINERLKELMENMQADTTDLDELNKEVKNLIRYTEELEKLRKNRGKVFSNLKDEIERKLEEFGYTSAEIYPDLQNRLSSIKTKYSNSSVTKQTLRIEKV